MIIAYFGLIQGTLNRDYIDNQLLLVFVKKSVKGKVVTAVVTTKLLYIRKFQNDDSE